MENLISKTKLIERLQEECRYHLQRGQMAYEHVIRKCVLPIVDGFKTETAKEADNSRNVCWCKDCQSFDCESEACCNPNSEWCADFPSLFNSCKYCERRTNIENEMEEEQ